ncbi:FMN reductase [Oxalicibacterium flavum]|uniref:FMN reductase n=1 Tax=Oxalicibacterium flavum TaxID=179467 RepID=A0A8J2XVQ4_9BURK|nr:flavin reductase family protein [Oxalicibacterium flavum]GGC18282.1 FMN reductase [Oxalicibacterium flavum]
MAPDILLKQAMRGVASTVVIVTTGDVHGERHAMTANSFTSVSLQPPTVLVCINLQASLYEPVRRLDRFCINILGQEHEDVARMCSGRAADRFVHPEWRFNGTGLPYLAKAQAVLFCETSGHHLTQTHAVVLGEVSGGLQQAAAPAPLLYLDGRFLCAPKS